MSNFDIRRVGPGEPRAASDAIRAALLGGPISDEEVERSALSWSEGRFLAAWEGERCIAHVGSFDFDSTVPGGARVRTAGVTRVGVLPTHTRRGLLTRMMAQLLEEERAAGSVLATLWASETSIYGRFGFGHGSDTQSIEVDTVAAAPIAGASTGSMRLLDRAEVDDVVPPLYDRVARRRPGTVSRQDWMFERTLRAAREPAENQESPGVYVAVHSDADGNDDGYVLYDVKITARRSGKIEARGTVRELWGVSGAVEIELWRYLLDIDLVDRWSSEARPIDESVRRALRDGRAYGVTQRYDELWVRMLDVDAALGARRYGATTATVSIEVEDHQFADNCGRWRIDATGATRTDDTPDLSVDIATLSAAYLGGVPWVELLDAGFLGADAPVEALDALFAVRPAPFCGTEF